MSAFAWETSDLWSGRVRLDFSADALVGVGPFKTMQTAHLMLSPLRPADLGSINNQPIVIKRSYIGTDCIAAAPFVCPSLGEKANRLYHAANIMYWAKALLKLTYDYIDRAIDNADEALPF